MSISARDQMLKLGSESRLKGFVISDDIRLKVMLLQWMTGKNGSEIAEDAVKLLYAVYSLLPREMVDSVLQALDDHEDKKTEKLSRMLSRWLAICSTLNYFKKHVKIYIRLKCNHSYKEAERLPEGRRRHSVSGFKIKITFMAGFRFRW